MVLIRARSLLLLLLPLLVAGCSESLFDGHGPDDRDRGPLDPTKCPRTCLADAAADFATPRGTRWRYLDDHGDRRWSAMSREGAGAARGADPADEILRCADAGGAPACAAMPGALLIRSGGAPSGADPALAYRIEQTGMVRVGFAAYVATGGAPQQIRIYRNSREDALATVTVGSDREIDRSFVVPAVAGDRFLLAVDEAGGAGGEVAVHFFLSAPDADEAPFPGACRLALTFEERLVGGAENELADHCASAPAEFFEVQETPIDLQLTGEGPFPELGNAALILSASFYRGGRPLALPGAATVQLWVKHAPTGSEPAYAFASTDAVHGGGVDIVIQSFGNFDVVAAEADGRLVSQRALYPQDGEWHFVRVVYASSRVDVCLDGRHVTDFAFSGTLGSGVRPQLGRGLADTYAYLYGGVDDVRVFAGALPCAGGE